MATSTKPITFIVPGHAQPTAHQGTRGSSVTGASAGSTQGRVKQSVQVGVARGGGEEIRITAVPGEDVVVLHIPGGPDLTLHPETARDLMLAQGDESKPARRAGSARRPDDDPAEVKVPTKMFWRGLEQGVTTRGAIRGFLGEVLLSGIDIVTGFVIDKAAEFAASQIVRRFDAQVDAGLYSLNFETLAKLKGSSTRFKQLPAASGGEPLLILVHGMFSETHGTFSRFWTQHPQRVRSLFRHYGGRVYALEQPTLGVSPAANALTLANALPDNACVHMLTHSSGGLVAEVLARLCSDPGAFQSMPAVAARAELERLAAVIRKKRIRLERVVRVACPARGTLLASKRLDAFLSVFKWMLETAGVPVAPLILDFLYEVARRRADPDELPGLAALVPDSPLLQWLHRVDAPVAGELRVVAGDLEGDSITSWLKTLLADSFYWTDNDLVVQTRSMYGGAPRAKSATFILDQGGTVSHFNYFRNELTAEAVVNALVQDTPRGFRVIGPLSLAGESSTGFRGQSRGPAAAALSSEKPAVFILPGICGSNLQIDGKRIWLGWRLINGLSRLKYDPASNGKVLPDGPIGLYYDDLGDFLSSTHDVIDFPFDWRLPIEDEARRLGAAVDAALAQRTKSAQPVRMIAHSMGGLVARTMQLECPEIWKKMMAHQGGRVLMLGTPNGGSWAPMQVLSGDDTFGGALVAVGAPFKDHEARELLAAFPGFIQLQAALLDDGLGKNSTWQGLADEDLDRIRKSSWWHRLEMQIDDHRWGVPLQGVLDQARALRQRLDAQRDKDLVDFRDKLLLVVGESPLTPAGYELGGEGLVYADTPLGDGRVTLESAQLPGVRTWKLNCAHGDLPREKNAFAGYLELLQSGTTELLPQLTAGERALRGAAAGLSERVRSRPSRTRVPARPRESEGELYTPVNRQPLGTAARSKVALKITVINGDLTFIRQPLLLGHYRSMKLTGTERVMDGLIGGAMEKSLQMNLYPDPPGTSQVFLNNKRNHADNPWQVPRPEAVIVAGLGPEGELRSTDLVRTVRQAVIAWSQRLAEKRNTRSRFFELAATLIGSGGANITPGQSAQLIAQGVCDANQRLSDAEWPCVNRLDLIEVYLDRATEAWRALQMQATDANGIYSLTEFVRKGTAALRRPIESGYRGADYDLITAVGRAGQNGDKAIEYTLDTRRARTEIRAQAAQTTLLRELIVSASNTESNDTQIGRTLFRLLVPIDIQPFLSGSTEMVLDLDNSTAGIPWELLDSDTPSGGDPRPWAIRAKLLRKLRTEEFRTRVVDAGTESDILVIGEPKCDVATYPRLPGARDEAQAVVRCFAQRKLVSPERLRALIGPDDPAQFGPDARAVINAVFERNWRIVHIAGHGALPADGAGLGGVVLSNGTFLGPTEIGTMPVVPELVFVNCCHLAARNPNQILSVDRVRFAAGVAEQLIRIGVRCVIAAGWAVNDGAASIFATTFYDSLLQGRRFIEAVGEARAAAMKMGGNTWAAYQCYGDPEWTFLTDVGDAQRPARPLTEEFEGISSPEGLILALESIAVRLEYPTPGDEGRPSLDEDGRAKLRHLEERFEPMGKGIGRVAEAFGHAWTLAGDRKIAMSWYEKALKANDGSASIKAGEQLANLRAREAWATVDTARNRHDASKTERVGSPGTELEFAL